MIDKLISKETSKRTRQKRKFKKKEKRKHQINGMEDQTRVGRRRIDVEC